MKTSTLMRVLTLSLVLGLLASSVQADASKDDLKSLQGVWNMVYFRTAELEVRDARAFKEQIRVEDGIWTAVTEGRDGIRSEIELGGTKSFKTIDLTSKYVDEDIFEIELVRGLYKIEGDTLTVINSKVGEDRPESFKFGGTAVKLAVYKKAKK